MSDNKDIVVVRSEEIIGKFTIGETVKYNPEIKSFIFTINKGNYTDLKYVPVADINNVAKFDITNDHKKLLNDMIPKDNVINPTDVNGGRAKHSRKTRRVRKSKRKGARKSRKH